MELSIVYLFKSAYTKDAYTEVLLKYQRISKINNYE